MMRNLSRFYCILVIAQQLAFAATALDAQSVLARAEAEPSVMTVGEVSTYSIHFLNTDSIPRLNTPRVEGLEFGSTPSTSSYKRIENGRFSIETTMSWSFRATRLGSFVIPGRSVEVKGEVLRIPDVEIRIIEQTEEQKSRAMLILEMPEQPYYVGQSLQSRLILLGRSDLRLSPVRLPSCENDLIQHTELNNNQQRGSLQYKGRTYNAIVWNIIITPIKAGKTQLQFRQDLELQTISRDSRFPSIFSMTSTQSEQLTVYTDELHLDILPLPDKPDSTNFSGAIGQFEMRSSLDSTSMTQGEPATLKLILSGEGNFERITPPELPQWDNWKIYPPKVSFEQEDEVGYKGVKSFEYILIPQSDALSEVPAFNYAIFDPESNDYKVMEIPAVAVDVAASELSSAINTFIPDPDGMNAEPRVPEKLLSLRTDLGRYYPKNSILWKEPSFWMANALTAILLLSLAGWQHRRNRLRTDHRLARRHAGSRKVRKALQAAATAARLGDAAGYYGHARFALQESLCHLSHATVEAKSLVTSDCLLILREAGISGELLQSVQSLLEQADACQFAGALPEKDALLTSHKDLISIITLLNRATR